MAKINSGLSDNSRRLMEIIDNFQTIEATCISCGIYKAAKLLMNLEDIRPKAMLIMTDGVANICETDQCVKEVFPNANPHSCVAGEDNPEAKAEAVQYAQWAMTFMA